MSAKKNDASTYISIGTIRVRSEVAGGSIKTMFFTPTKEFSVSHASKENVVLLPAEGNSGCGILAPFDSKKGLRIRVNGSRAATVEAAISHCPVEIELKAKCRKSPLKDSKKLKWSLRAITIPGGGQTT